VRVVKHQSVAAAAHRGLATDAKRGPYLTRLGQFTPKRADIIHTLMAMQLNSVEVHQRRNVGDRA
jgi:hypothetical protein